MNWVHNKRLPGMYELWYIGRSWSDFEYRVVRQPENWILSKGDPGWKNVCLPLAEYTLEQALALCPLLTRIE